jgi:hypothetical protein
MKCFLLFFSFYALLFQSCGNRDLLIDKSLIQETSDKHPFPGRPYFVHFKNGDRNLFYIAAFHEKKASSKTFELVTKVFQKYRFDCVIVEGIPFNKGESPKEIVDMVRGTSKDDYYEYGEAAFTILKATESKIPFYGAESPAGELKGVLKIGDRDRYIVAAIESLVNRHKSVLIVYGDAHLATQRRALEAAYGKPVLLSENIE